MKGLDTPVLIKLLRGDPKVVAHLKKVRAEELCTTAINLFELEMVARNGPRNGREKRLAAVERLRRKLTVLAVDEGASRAAALASSTASGSSWSGLTALIVGALLSGGCKEWWTVREANFPTLASLKVTIFG